MTFLCEVFVKIQSFLEQEKFKMFTGDRLLFLSFLLKRLDFHSEMLREWRKTYLIQSALTKGQHSKHQPTHSLWRLAYSHQPYVDTLYVLLPRRRRPKLVLTGTSIPLEIIKTSLQGGIQ